GGAAAGDDVGLPVGQGAHVAVTVDGIGPVQGGQGAGSVDGIAAGGGAAAVDGVADGAQAQHRAAVVPRLHILLAVGVGEGDLNGVSGGAGLGDLEADDVGGGPHLLRQLFAGEGDRPVVVRDPVRHRRLIGVDFSGQIGVVVAPDVDGALTGPAVVGGVHRLLGHLAVVPQVLPAGLLHRPAAIVAHLGHAFVRLAVDGIAQIEAVALVLAGPEGSVG